MRTNIRHLMVFGAILLGFGFVVLSFYRPADMGRQIAEIQNRPKNHSPLLIPIQPWSAAQCDIGKVQIAIRKTEPYFEYRRVYDLLHALELWGSEAIFSNEAPFSVPNKLKPIGSREMIRFLLEGQDFKKYYRYEGVRSTSLLTPTPYGVREQKGEEPFKSPHLDNVLAVCAEIGLPLDTIIDLGDQRFSLNDLLKDAMARFDINQEIEFTTVAFVRYLPPTRSWSDRFDRIHTFDEIAAALLKREPGYGVCYGIHTLYAMATLLRIDDQYKILSTNCRENLGARLDEILLILRKTMKKNGAWGRDWSTKINPAIPWEIDILAELRSTSHHIQWMAIAPERYRIEDIYAKRASNFLLESVIAFRESDLSLSHDYPVLSHAGHALVQPFGCVDAWQFVQKYGRPGGQSEINDRKEMR